MQWWRSGKLTGRILWLGVLIGALEMVLFFAYYAPAQFDPRYPAMTVTSLLYLVVIEIPLSVLFTSISACVTLVALLASRAAPRAARAALAGFTGLAVQGLLVFILFNSTPLDVTPWIAASVAGILAGGIFAAFTYWRLGTRRTWTGSATTA